MIATWKPNLDPVEPPCVRTCAGIADAPVCRRMFEWGQGDIYVFVVASWALHEHANSGGEHAILFSVNDHPVIKKLGFYREEALTDKGGFQSI